MTEIINATKKPNEKPACSWPFNKGGESPIAPMWTKLYNSAKFVAILSIAFGILVCIVVWLIYKSFRLPDTSIYQELCVVSAAAITTFLGTPIVIKFSAKQRWLVVPLMLALAVTCIAFAFFREGVLRNLLVEAAVAMLLIIGLELMFHQSIHVVHARYQAAQKDLDEEEEWNRDFPFGPPRKPSQD